MVLTPSIPVSWVGAESEERSASLTGSPPSFLCLHLKRIPKGSRTYSPLSGWWATEELPQLPRFSVCLSTQTPCYFRSEAVFTAKVSIAIVCLLKHFPSPTVKAAL